MIPQLMAERIIYFAKVRTISEYNWLILYDTGLIYISAETMDILSPMQLVYQWFQQIEA